MSVNKFKILQPRLTDKEINLPIEMTWDFLDRSNDIEVYEEKVIKDVINQDKDFEVTRFSFVAPVGIQKSDINYEFNFVPSGATSATTIWSPSLSTLMSEIWTFPPTDEFKVVVNPELLMY